MKEIKADDPTAEDKQYFNPWSKGYKYMTCCCGFELILESDGTYRCTGGNHRYNVREGTVVYGKNGEVMIKMPDEKEGDKNGKR